MKLSLRQTIQTYLQSSHFVPIRFQALLGNPRGNRKIVYVTQLSHWVIVCVCIISLSETRRLQEHENNFEAYRAGNINRQVLVFKWTLKCCPAYLFLLSLLLINFPIPSTLNFNISYIFFHFHIYIFPLMNHPSVSE